MRPPRLLIASAALLASTLAARAVIVIGPDDNLSAPTTGAAANAPWEYVVRLGVNNASGVYLGNGYLITANHVNVPADALINGNLFQIDPAYTPVQIDGADIKLLHILGNPGLAPLPLIDPGDNEFSKACAIIGWGVGPGAAIPDEGFNWGDDSTRAQRWGTNTTLGSYLNSGGTLYLQTAFNFNSGNDEAAVTLGDSGSALFANFGGTWKLTGITVGADSNSPSMSRYDQLGLPGHVGDVADNNYFIPISQHRASIQGSAPLPEPSSALLLMLGATLLGRRPRRHS